MMGRICSMHEEINSCKILVRKAVRKRPFDNHRHRWEDDIRMDCIEPGHEGLIWVELASSGRLYEHGDEPSCSIKTRIFLTVEQLLSFQDSSWNSLVYISDQSMYLL
jgi:hypothetical protein